MSSLSPITLTLIALISLLQINSKQDTEKATLVQTITPKMYLFETRDFVVSGSKVLTLTQNAPVIDIFGQKHISFGRMGRGPGEFQQPTMIDINKTNDKIGIIDFPAPGFVKLSLYSKFGNLKQERMLREVEIVSDFSFVNDDQILLTTNKHGKELATLTLFDGEKSHVIYKFKNNRITLTLNKGPVPEHTITKPYSTTFNYSPYNNSKVAVWQGGHSIDILNLGGELVDTFEIPNSKFELTADLKEHWINKNFPEGKKLFGKKISILV